MRPIPFKKLIQWIFEEYKQHKSIFGIPEVKFFSKNSKSHIKIFGENCEIPIGPAAGPHTQLSQNIIASYLSGARFFELKTVQIKDDLDIEKPCIEAEDEGYNTEWSTELTVSQAYQEYVKAWFLIHIIKKIFSLSKNKEKAFVFNMSVGYDLSGIKSPKIDSFIEGLKDAYKNEYFNKCKHTLKKELKIINYPQVPDNIDNYIDNISTNISNSITLSTMHGCPPEEQEAICKYLIEEKNLHTFVKLNPTLLGYNYVRNLFNEMGYSYIQLKKESFTNDLQYNDAIQMLKELKTFAIKHNREFGIKLSNTLPVINSPQKLPTDEMYMSGRTLFPLTINLAKKISEEFEGDIKISYAGGASHFNIKNIFATGIYPITLATNLLKPGGYLRLKQLAEDLEQSLLNYNANKIDNEKLKLIADSAIQNKDYFKNKKITDNHKINKQLPLFDCALTPCVENCPIHQDIPEYIKLINDKQYEQALKLILQKNPLPFITGYICDHKCQLNCTRNYYEDSLLIRDLRRIAAEKGFEKIIGKITPSKQKIESKVAIIGAGPTGLSAGYFLSKYGFDVTIFDKRKNPGGTVQYVIPDFRLPRKAIENDIEIIKMMGVKFQHGVKKVLSIKDLKEKGKYICLAIGSGKTEKLRINGNKKNIISVIEFLEQFNIDKAKIKLGENVAVIGGGNSAMDGARAATRVKSVKKVFILYRRTKEFMPANIEEFNNAIAEEVIFKELLNPVSFSNKILKCQKMKLGEKDNTGRKKPIPIENEFEEFKIDTAISAIGEVVDTKFLLENGIEFNKNRILVNEDTLETNLENVYIGGDALRGPSTVIEAIADGTKIANSILIKEGISPPKDEKSINIAGVDKRINDINIKKGYLQKSENGLETDNQIEKESQRCLECNLICNRCVEVCPNRANVAIKTKSSNFNNIYQIIHIDGMCNECGNCATFCPYENGKPYKDKLTLFWNEEDFINSKNNGFILKNSESLEFRIRLDNKIYDIKFNDEGEIISGIPAFNDELSDVIKIIWKVYKDYKYLL
ncbi:MAG: putative selenate reductase subunit YgfK [Candidatus Cloacimonadota bacterium]|nr:putative selenate reductase subunit YgfK [Candidatus Cloacimonadota bacterium]